MPTPRFRRRLDLLASTSLIACALIITPVTVGMRADKPVGQQVLDSRAVNPTRYGEQASFDSKYVDKNNNKMHFDSTVDRRAALAQLGLDESISYAFPIVVTLSRASADGGSGGGSGGGGSGGGGSGGGGSGGGGSGGGGSGGGGSGGSGSGGGSGASGASGASSASASSSGNSGGRSDAFGGVEQVGNDLSADQESEAIGNGWQ